MRRLLCIVLAMLLLLSFSACKRAGEPEEMATADDVVQKEEQPLNQETDQSGAEKEEPQKEPEDATGIHYPNQKAEESEQVTSEESGQAEPSEGTCGTVNNPAADKVEFADSTFFLEKITVGELENILDYNVYYYGVKNFYAEEGKELRSSLKENPKIIQTLLGQCEKDAKAEQCIKGAMYDGGSVLYKYPYYSILKLHKMITRCAEDGTLYDDYQEALIIGTSGMQVDAVVKRMADWKGVGTSWRPDKEEGYIYEDSTDPIKPALVLDPEDQRFIFTWSAFSSYRAVGFYNMDEKELHLQTDDGKYYFWFERSGDTLIFRTLFATPLPKYKYSSDAESKAPLTDGAVFKKQ